ncbi:Conidial pigment polyketide synthase PfmaE [Labeo rohita]|uniref:Conidial pigment polyketide synthase PfmaE n=1 Tax=Labeo rohita TaxID=84645 RepID=A0ABQ8LYZ8_LABRO|nr:Conidial pigment polyketide synthase PfmaE [Labeo rohita]
MLLEIPEIHESLKQCLLINKPQQKAISKAGVNMSKTEKSMTSNSPHDYLRFMIGETTGVEMDELNDDVHLFDLGIDSVLAMTLQNLIFNDRGVNVPLVTPLDPNSTLSTLIKILEDSCVDEYQSENEIKSTYL